MPKAGFFSGTLRQLPSPARMAPYFQIKGEAIPSPSRNRPYQSPKSAGLGDEAQQLGGGQGQDAEHQVAHHLGIPPDPDEPPSEFVLQPRVGPLDRAPLIVAHRLRRETVKVFASPPVPRNQCRCLIRSPRWRRISQLAWSRKPASIQMQKPKRGSNVGCKPFSRPFRRNRPRVGRNNP